MKREDDRFKGRVFLTPSPLFTQPLSLPPPPHPHPTPHTQSTMRILHPPPPHTNPCTRQFAHTKELSQAKRKGVSPRPTPPRLPPTSTPPTGHSAHPPTPFSRPLVFLSILHPPSAPPHISDVLFTSDRLASGIGSTFLSFPPTPTHPTSHALPALCQVFQRQQTQGGSPFSLPPPLSISRLSYHHHHHHHQL